MNQKFVWSGSASEVVLAFAWYREIAKDPFSSKIEVIESLSPAEKAVFKKENRNIGSAYRRLCYMLRSGIL
ncbi:hypothetical protein ACFDTO_21280 [Microbacteriaceae bacterium 4G12]